MKHPCTTLEKWTEYRIKTGSSNEWIKDCTENVVPPKHIFLFDVFFCFVTGFNVKANERK